HRRAQLPSAGAGGGDRPGGARGGPGGHRHLRRDGAAPGRAPAPAGRAGAAGGAWPLSPVRPRPPAQAPGAGGGRARAAPAPPAAARYSYLIAEAVSSFLPPWFFTLPVTVALAAPLHTCSWLSSAILLAAR